MKVIGLTTSDSWRTEYICVIAHDEIQKVFDKCYGDKKIEKLKAGEALDLGVGYDFRGEIREACRRMTEAENQFERARATLHKFAAMVAGLPLQVDEAEEKSA